MSSIEAAQSRGNDGIALLSSKAPTVTSENRRDAIHATDPKGNLPSPSTTSGLRKRKRVLLACKTCRLRKRRCDGLQPKCTHCNQQKLDCFYESANQKAEVSQLYVHNLLMRIENLEGEVEAERSHKRAPAAELGRDEQSVFHISSPRESISMPQGGQEHDTFQESPDSALSDVAQRSNNHRTDDDRPGPQGAYPTPETLELPVQSYLGPASNISFLETFLTPNQEPRQQSPRHRERELAVGAKGTDMALQSSSSEALASLSSLADSWPQRHLADYIVECYMEFCYPQYPFLHGPTIQKRYESIWTAKEPQSKLWTGTMNIVLALGCQFSADLSPQLGQEFFKKATSLIDFGLHGSGTLETLQALILMSLYLQSSANLDYSWNIIGVAVRQAQSLGLHLSKTYKSSWTPLGRETRKRAWWACYVLDSASGMMLGRPQMISDDTSTWVDLPTFTDEELSMSGAQEAPQRPRAGVTDLEPFEAWAGGNPSELAFFLATIKQCGLMREVTKVYDRALDHWRVLDIDDRLCQWISKASPSRRTGIEIDANNKFWRQNQVLISRFLNLRVLLHRPCVSQNAVGPAVTPYDPVRTVAGARLTSLRAELCTNAATELIEHISKFYAHGLNSAWWYDSNYLFSATTVILVQMPQQHHKAHHYRHTVGLAMDVMRLMQRSGKALAGEYLSMVEKLQQQVDNQISAKVRLSNQTSSVDLNGSGPIDGDRTGKYGGDAQIEHFPEPMQFEAEEAQEMTLTDFTATMGETDWNALLESLSFPWNRHPEPMSHNDDLMACFPGSMEFNPTYDF